MEKKIIIPRLPFYFVRHGQTDWNKNKTTLCNQDDIPLNETGLQQAAAASGKLNNLGISKIISSPLERAQQTAKIINNQLALPMELHAGLREIVDENVAAALAVILDQSHSLLIVSHGEVYRVLLRILNAQAEHANAKNGGVYLFTPSDSHADQWMVVAIGDEE